MIPVSVVVPAFNAARTLRETLATVRAQTAAPLETIVVDDGSTDATSEIARANGAIVVRQTNRGLPAARNAGVARATAPWVAHLDADDLWAPDKLARTWDAVRADPEPGVVFSDFWQFDENGLLNASVIREVHRHFANVRRRRIANDVWRCDRATLADALARQGVMQPSTLLVRKALLDEVGGSDETIRLGEDIELELRLLARSDALFVDVPLMGYRRQAESMSRNATLVRAGDVAVTQRVFRERARYLESTVRWYERERAPILFRAGRMAVAESEHRTGRHYLRESLRVRASAPALGWLALSFAADNPLGRAGLARAKKAWFALRTLRERGGIAQTS